MSSAASIPRFLLPRSSAIWRTRLPNSNFTIRHASNKAHGKKSKPIVLEQPKKFNPPSHGSRLPRQAPRYPGPQLSAEEVQAQKKKQYPNMMPPEGTFMHWFLNNRSIHIYITLGTLFSLALTVSVTNFKRDSPFADMLPHWSQLFTHPIAFTRTVVEVLRLHAAHVTAETQERRNRKVEDVEKRSEYRKAHGLDKDEGFGGWTAKTNDQLLGPAVPTEEVNQDGQSEPTIRPQPPARKWLGIW
ncbi:hypothetical protein F5884DRAFT_288961 [Xylogone sp. PMI_703]|nr:hypothetical protein F5884DRAFT_288961 [Xylogone sp. PMI_703]